MGPTSAFRLSWLWSLYMKGRRYFPPRLQAVWREDKGESEKIYHIDQISAKINFLWRRQCLHPSKTTKCLRVSAHTVSKNKFKCTQQLKFSLSLAQMMKAIIVPPENWETLRLPQPENAPNQLTLVHNGTIKCKIRFLRFAKIVLWKPPNLDCLVHTQRQQKKNTGVFIVT